MPSLSEASREPLPARPPCQGQGLSLPVKAKASLSRSSDPPRAGWSDFLLMTDSAMFGANLYTMKPQTPKTGVAHCGRDIQWLGSRTKYHPGLSLRPTVPVLRWLPWGGV